MHALLPEQRDERRASGLRHHLAQHRTEGNHDRDESQDSTNPFLKRLHDADKGHSRRRPQAEGHRDQRDEGVQLEAPDQHDKRYNGAERQEQQLGVGAHTERFTRSATIASGAWLISHTHARSSGDGSSRMESWLSSSAGGMK